MRRAIDKTTHRETTPIQIHMISGIIATSLFWRISEIPWDHTQSPHFKDRVMYKRHLSGFVRRILSTPVDAGSVSR
jgi:hypothetical protein